MSVGSWRIFKAKKEWPIWLVESGLYSPRLMGCWKHSRIFPQWVDKMIVHTDCFPDSPAVLQEGKLYSFWFYERGKSRGWWKICLKDLCLDFIYRSPSSDQFHEQVLGSAELLPELRSHLWCYSCRYTVVAGSSSASCLRTLKTFSTLVSQDFLLRKSHWFYG